MGCLSILRVAREKNDADQASVLSTLPLFEKTKMVGSEEGMRPLDTSGRLGALRKLMAEEGVRYYMVPSEDEHASEYTPAHMQRRSFISGFTGSTGVVIVTWQSAHLFADGRYWIQAGQQLDENWTLHKVPLVKDWDAWMVDESLKQGGISIGVDPKLITYSRMTGLLSRLEATNASFVFPSRNLVDIVWGAARPAPLDAPVHVHPLKFAGQSAQEKLSKLATWLSVGGDKSDPASDFPEGSPYIINELDQIAWMLNLRGASIPCNPVFPSYLLVKPEKGTYSARLFVPSELLPKEAKNYLQNDLKVEVDKYDGVWDYLTSGQWSTNAQQKLVCGEKVSWGIVNAVGAPNAHVLTQSPLAIWKAIKNKVEVEGMRRAYLRDGVCWVKWAAWLDESIRVKGKKVDERAAADALIKERQMAENYAGMEAYEASSASGENAALPHYETPETGSRVIDRTTPYLCDSGAQFFDGTIDTTRTVHFGKPTAEQKRAFTRVLQGHIAIETSIFPRGTTGWTLDVKARNALWKDGMNYAHGTGHGIGSFLNVHEGPQGFSTSSGGSQNPVPLQENMYVSNEPGFYEEGSFGIRIESCIRVKSVKTRRGFNGDNNWLAFERVTVVPIDTNLIEYSLMNKEERAWLKDHNRWCKEQLKPMLKDDKRTLRWLQKQ